MIQDILAVMWKEWREALRLQGGKIKGLLGLIVGLGIPCVVFPLQCGKAWVESPMVLGLCAWMAMIPVMMVIADSFAGERERHTLETLLASRLSNRAILFGKAAVGIGYGWGATVAVLIIGLVSVNIANRGEGFLMYSAEIFWGAVVLSFLTASLATGVGILVSLKASTTKQAQQALSFAIMLIWLVPFFGINFLPATWKSELFNWIKGIDLSIAIVLLALIFLVLDVLFFGLAFLRFQRTKLILD